MIPSDFPRSPFVLEIAMQNTTKTTPHQVTVFSEGVRFQGLRTPRAYVWVAQESYAPVSTTRHASTQPRISRSVQAVTAMIAQGNLTKAERQFCRKVLAGLPASQAALLAGAARRLMSPGSR